MADYFAACRARMPAFTPAGFASMIHSVARLGYWPGQPFMAAFEAEVTSRGLDTFTRGELWKLAHGLATLRHRPSDAFLAAYFRAFNAKAGNTLVAAAAGGGGSGAGGNGGGGGGMGKLTVKDVSLVLWSMAALDAGAAHAPALAALVDAAAALVARHQLEPQGDEHASRPGRDDPAVLKYRQLVQAGLYYRTLGDPALDAALDRLDAALAEAWRPHAAPVEREEAEAVAVAVAVPQEEMEEEEGLEGEEDVPSHSAPTYPTPTFHGAVLELLEEQGVRVAAGTLHDVFNLELLLSPLPGKGGGRGKGKGKGAGAGAEEPPVVLLLEGRGHFFTNALSRQTGDAAFRQRIVAHAASVEGRFKATGQVTIWEWRAGKGKAGRLRLLRSRLRSLGVDPDVYIPAPSARLLKEEEEEQGEWTGDDGDGRVHHVAAELVVAPEAGEMVAEAATPVVDAEVEQPIPPAPSSSEADVGVRNGHGVHGHNRRRGGKRRFVVAAAQRASKAAAAAGEAATGAEGNAE